MRGFKVYLAGPLFSLAEREFNKRLVNALREKLPNLNFIVPQDYAATIHGQTRFLDSVFEHCIKSIDEADAMLCILEGPDVDSGTCIEMGYAYARGKPIIGVRTDFRASEDKGVNLMVSKVCREFVGLSGSRVTEEKLIEEVVVALSRVLASDRCTGSKLKSKC